MFDLTDVGYVHRIVIGSNDPEKLKQEEEIRTAAELLNRFLNDSPKGRIIGIEKTFNILNIGEHQVVLQAMIYHIGFPRKPFWLAEPPSGSKS